MKYLILCLAIFLSGCDVITDQFFDCIDYDVVEFDVKSLPIATLNEEYHVGIVASIKREPNDSSFMYVFDLDGDLPQGVEFVTNGNSRYVSLEGVPVELGDFEFILSVEIPEGGSAEVSGSDGGRYDDGDDLCSNSYSRSYTLSVDIGQ